MDAADQMWKAISPLPVPNGGFVSVVVDGKILVVGGTNWRDDTKHWLSDVVTYDPVENTWSALPPLESPLAHGVGGTTGPQQAVIAGGTDGAQPRRTLLLLEAGRVREVPSSMPPAVGAAGDLAGTPLLLVGGTPDIADLSALTRKCVAIDPSTGTVKELAPYPGPPVGLAAAAFARDELLVFGGCTWDAPRKAVVNLDEAYAFNPETGAWRVLARLPDKVRGISAVALNQRYIYLAGGFSDAHGGFTDRAYLYDIQLDRYTAARPLPYAAFVNLVRYGEDVYVLGGEDRAKHRTSQAFRISAAALLPR